MSEEALQRFLDRLNADDAFRESVRGNPAEALKEFDLSPAERVALATGDEDALRRLAGADVAAFGASMLINCQAPSLNPLGVSSPLFMEQCGPCQQPPVAVPPSQGLACAHPVSVGGHCSAAP